MKEAQKSNYSSKRVTMNANYTIIHKSEGLFVAEVGDIGMDAEGCQTPEWRISVAESYSTSPFVRIERYQFKEGRVESVAHNEKLPWEVEEARRYGYQWCMRRVLRCILVTLPSFHENGKVWQGILSQPISWEEACELADHSHEEAVITLEGENDILYYVSGV
jgi:hypothetical protein